MNKVALDQVRREFLSQTKDFKSFVDPGADFVQHEDAYKRKAAAAARALLEPFVTGGRVLSTDADARKLGNELFDLTNFFNWRDRSYINEELLREDKGAWLEFMQKMLVCLGKTPDGNWQESLGGILAWIKERGCPANISKILPIYFLFLWDPKNHFFLKASVLDRFLPSIGESKLGKGVKLTVEGYEKVLRIIKDLRGALGDWKPRDNIDLQSFAYLADQSRSLGKIQIPLTELSDAIKPDSMPIAPLRRPELPLNLILAGPPGTGKTYTIRKIYAPMFEEIIAARSKEDFIRELGSTLTWREAAAVALNLLGGKAKVRNLADHEVVQAKLKFQAKKTKVENTLWSQLQMATVADCKNVNYKTRIGPGIFWKDESSVWSFAKNAEDDLADILQIAERIRKYEPESTLVIRHETVTFHQSYSYEDFVEGIKPILSDGEDDSAISVQYDVVPGIFKRMAARAESDPIHFYALFIDEINRGNISNIFGELITLIEDDKRHVFNDEKKWHGGLAVKLPYSHTEFAVPNNLFLIGTMNTADRSIALMDLALRRRFTFKEISPTPELLATQPGPVTTDEGEIRLDKMLSVINQRIEYLLDRDHAIGHSYLMGCKTLDDLDRMFRDKLLPLLQEYFYGDWEKIQLVLGDLVDESDSDSKHKNHTFAIVRHVIQKSSKLFKLNDEAYQDRRSYAIVEELPAASFQKIYENI